MKNLTIILGALFTMLNLSLYAQTGGAVIANGAATADGSAILDIQSTTKGILVPRVNIADLATADPVTSPALSLLVYNTNTSTGVGFYYWDSSAWVSASGAKAINDLTDGITGNFNTFLGEDVGTHTTGAFNTATGAGAMEMNTTGTQNVATGALALHDNTTGESNSAIGALALKANTGGSYNTAGGFEALKLNTTGENNTATGYQALFKNKTGTNNTAAGYWAAYHTLGSGNTAFGENALQINTTGTNNTALGFGADVSANNLTNATAIGYNAKVATSNSLVLGGTGADTVRVGIGTTSPAAALDITSTDNGILLPRVDIADLATADPVTSPVTSLLVYNTNTTTGEGFYYWEGTKWQDLNSISNKIADADNDTKVQVEKNADEDIIRFDMAGTEFFRMDSARLEVLNSGQSVFIGEGAGAADDLSDNHNVFVGYHAGQANTTGTFNTAYGDRAFENNTTGNENTATGAYALRANTTGIDNTATGVEALRTNTEGNYNTASGGYSLHENTTGNNNTANGYHALQANTTGESNTASGYRALQANTTGESNTASGYWALYFNTGNNNTAFGAEALTLNTTGENNTAIGYFAYREGTHSNSTAVGYNTDINADNQIRMGNSAVSSIGGHTNWSNLSDGRFKTNVQENVAGLDFIMKLRPLTYHLDMDALARFNKTPDSLRLVESDRMKAAEVQIGFIAQEVEEAATELGFDFHGVDKPKNEDSHYGLRYAEFVVPLVKAVQEQQAIIEKLEESNAKLEASNARLEESNARIEKRISELEKT